MNNKSFEHDFTGLEYGTWKQSVKWSSVEAVITLSGSVWGPFNWQFLDHKSNAIKFVFYCHPKSNKVIAIKVCTHHNSCAVMTCAKVCGDMMTRNGMTEKTPTNFPLIWIVMEKLSVKQIPWLLSGVGGLTRCCMSTDPAGNRAGHHCSHIGIFKNRCLRFLFKSQQLFWILCASRWNLLALNL